MDWKEIKIHTSNEAVEPISNILHEAGASGVVIVDPQDLYKDRVKLYGTLYELDPSDYPTDGVFVKSYLPVTEELNGIVESVQQSVANLPQFGIDIGRNEVSLSEVKEEDWATAWKKYYKPIQVSKRITITPTWEDYEKTADDEIIIELDPGMAFGTGTHPTTILSLQAMERFTEQEDIVLDVGSGSGVLSIAAARLGAKKVHAFDLDEVAVSSTKNNSALNELENFISVNKNDLLHDVDIEADLIVSNILAEIIVQFTSDAYQRLKPGGHLITSGIIGRKKDEVKKDMESKGFEVLEVNELNDWISIVARKPNNQ